MQIGFYGGDPIKMVQDDLPLLRPTLFPSVPRLYNRIYGRIQDRLKEATGIKKGLLNWGFNSKMNNLKATGAVTSGCWDKIVFNKIKAMLGGRVRIMATGSAPLAGEVIDFLKVCFCADLLEGYGLTETCAGSCAQYPGDPLSGNVGGPVANVKVKLRDIPEMNYLTTNNPPQGEICFWGPSVMKGYFKNPEKTAEAFDGEWFRTGDVGEVAASGAIRIIDRAKNIFKLSQGEYIAPEKLENVYVQSTYILQAWIHGDSFHDFVILFAVVDPPKIEALMKKFDIKGSPSDALEDKRVTDEVMKDVYALAAENKFNSLEKPKQIKLLLDPFTVESDILTPTFKLKRNVAKDMFNDTIKDLYAKGFYQLPK
jgi:long-chain acyl-CoA synthetase